MSKRAVILAGGKGTRLRPYTISLPKPLVPVGETPILEIIVKQLAAHGFSRITMAVNHQAEIIKAFFQDGALIILAAGVKVEAPIHLLFLFTTPDRGAPNPRTG